MVAEHTGITGKGKAFLLTELLQAGQETFPESTGEFPFRAEEPAITYSFEHTRGRQAAAGHTHVDMRMQFQVLSPGMKHSDNPRELLQGFPYGRKPPAEHLLQTASAAGTWLRGSINIKGSAHGEGS